MKCKCDNCNWSGPAMDTIVESGPISLLKRLDPTADVPVGGCPNCGCLVYERKQAASVSPVRALVGDILIALLVAGAAITATIEWVTTYEWAISLAFIASMAYVLRVGHCIKVFLDKDGGPSENHTGRGE